MDKRNPISLSDRLLLAVVAGLCITAGVLTLMSGWPITWHLHNSRMARFESSVRSMPLPPESRLVHTENAFGLLWGNSNHCDAEVIAVLETSATAQSVADFFSRPVVLDFPFQKGPAIVAVIQFDEEGLSESIDGSFHRIDQESGGVYASPGLRYYERWELRRIEELKSTLPHHSGKRHLLLIATDQSFDDWDLFDLRCH